MYATEANMLVYDELCCVRFQLFIYHLGLEYIFWLIGLLMRPPKSLQPNTRLQKSIRNIFPN